MALARNILIIALLAAGIAFLPNGGNVASAVMTAISMAFLGAIAWTVYRLFYQFQTGILALDDSRRIMLYGAFGLIVLLVAGASKMWSTGPGTLVWLLLLAAALLGIWRVVAEARSY